MKYSELLNSATQWRIEDLFRRRFLLLILKHDSYDYHQNQNQNQKLSLFLSLFLFAFVNHKNNNK